MKLCLRSVFIAGIAVSVLAGCSPVLPEPQLAPEPVTGYSNLDTDRANSILDELDQALKSADISLNSEELSPRVSEAALDMRGAFYKLAGLTGNPVTPLPITPKLLTVTSGAGWPRVMIDVTEPPEEGLNNLLILSQDSPRDPYKLSSWVRLFPKVQLPKTSTIDTGTPLLSPKAVGFLSSPEEAMSQYVGLLNDPETGKELFGSDPFTELYRSDQAKLIEAAGAAGTVTMHAANTDYPITAVALLDQGALVAGTISYSITYKHTNTDFKLFTGSDIKTLLGDGGEVINTVTGNYLATILMVIPPEDSTSPIRLLGAERVLTSVSRDDNIPNEDG